jgi:hypothetical protein
MPRTASVTRLRPEHHEEHPRPHSTVPHGNHPFGYHEQVNTDQAASGQRWAPTREVCHLGQAPS